MSARPSGESEGVKWKGTDRQLGIICSLELFQTTNGVKNVDKSDLAIN
jgi:hypothetical protein